MCYFPRLGPPTGPPCNNVSEDETVLLLLLSQDAHRPGLVCVLNADIRVPLKSQAIGWKVL